MVKKKDMQEVKIILDTCYRETEELYYETLGAVDTEITSESVKTKLVGSVFDIYVSDDVNLVGCLGQGLVAISLNDISHITEAFENLKEKDTHLKIKYSGRPTFNSLLGVYTSHDITLELNVDLVDDFKDDLKIALGALNSEYDISERLKNKVNNFLIALN